MKDRDSYLISDIYRFKLWPIFQPTFLIFLTNWYACFKNTEQTKQSRARVNRVNCDGLRMTEREILCPKVHQTPAGPAETCDSFNANTYRGHGGQTRAKQHLSLVLCSQGGKCTTIMQTSRISALETVISQINDTFFYNCVTRQCFANKAFKIPLVSGSRGG